MMNVENVTKCFGCRACEIACPTQCITLKENKQGFLQPSVNIDSCINCGLCLKKCQTLSNDVKEENKTCFVLQSKDQNNLEKSASGSLFYTVAKEAYKRKMHVFGCLFDSELRPIIKEARTNNDIEKMCGSKYVESDVLQTYKEVKTILENGEKVLYSGLPCQIAGLKKYLGKEYKELITMDLICHGTPSRKLFIKYIEYLEKKYKSKVLDIVFRSKKNIEWGRFVERVVFENKQRLIPSNLDFYYSAFFTNNTFKDACYSCPYAQKKQSEITIGDAWGETLSTCDKKGLSCIVVNNDKGLSFIKTYLDLFIYKSTTFESLSKNNKQLVCPSKKTKDNDFYNNIDGLEFEPFMKNNGVTISKKTLKNLKFKIKYYANVLFNK